MFATGDPAADESLDGCPVVRLPDAPSDLKHLLHFLVPSVGRSFLDHKRPIEFPELFAVVRLAHKYNIENLLEQALHVLKQFYTTSFSKYERRPHSHPNFARPRLVHHIGAVNLARLTNTLSILPIALYHCCALSGTVMDGWTRDTGETEYLSMQDLRAVLTARGELVGRGFAMLLNIFEDHPAQDCAQPGLCGIVLTGLIRSVEWMPSDECNVLDSWEVEIRRLARELEICKTCRRAMSKRDVKERRDVWDMLPAIFGLSKAECQWDVPVPGDDGSSDSDSD
ncbi:hypothetical protein GSI_12216 [Ganoderma sinense ZZ0214-1]|uniref:Uncharacterized protein n=1 Tax=Ganoderma sinense ZZ0214-1 TaxID=1077348 RepID=A0A2G8RYR3_9APHY|nr:hypothetical protein GSI_12216 [Ganoderma sinense ZZ0214-1]